VTQLTPQGIFEAVLTLLSIIFMIYVLIKIGAYILNTMKNQKRKRKIIALMKKEKVEILTFDAQGIPVMIKKSNGEIQFK